MDQFRELPLRTLNDIMRGQIPWTVIVRSAAKSSTTHLLIPVLYNPDLDIWTVRTWVMMTETVGKINLYRSGNFPVWVRAITNGEFDGRKFL